MPLLRQALRERRITYEKARLIARHKPDELQPWIEKARTTTCVALRREMEHHDEAQMCTRRTFGAWMTVSVAEVVKSAFRAARAAAKRWLAAGECLVRLAEHFIETWKEILKEVNTPEPYPKARSAFLSGPGMQQGGGPRAPHRAPIARRKRRPVEPGQPLRRAPSLWHPRRPHARDRQGAWRAPLGGRPSPQLRAHRGSGRMPRGRGVAVRRRWRGPGIRP